MENTNRDSYKRLQGLLVHHAHAGLHLLHQYRDTYGIAYLSPLQLVCLVLLCDASVRYDGVDEATPQIIQFCLTSLQDAKRGYPVAGALQKMFLNSLSEYNLPVPDELERLVAPSTHLGLEKLLDAFTRPTYKQPIIQILPNVDPNLARDFIGKWPHDLSNKEIKELNRGRGKDMDLSFVLDP